MDIFHTKRDLITSLIDSTESVLDVGFWGQAVKKDSRNWPHKILLKHAREVYGVDLEYDESLLDNPERYTKSSAENFSIDKEFDVIFASELIEHLSNPGMFLDCCAKHIKSDGRLILTTPNAFSLFTILDKFVKHEPSVNSDHTVYFNRTVLEKLLQKNGWYVEDVGYYDSFSGNAGWKREVVRMLYHFVNLFSPKFMDTLVVVAKKNS